MAHQKGNVLFLILIAVALFGALSYAVTQSTRGGSSADKETIELKAVEFIQQAALITQTIKRKYLLGYDGQIQFSQDPENLSGTVYLPNRTQTTGKTIGFFTPDISGLNTLAPPIETRTTGSSGWGIVYNSSLEHNGVHVGTSDGDEFIRMRHLTDEACIAINKGLHGESRIGSQTGGSVGGSSAATIALLYGTTFLSVTPGNYGNSVDIEFLPGCNARISSSNIYFELIKAN
jgi:type II secretory pathway pseudopilin PulG